MESGRCELDCDTHIPLIDGGDDHDKSIATGWFDAYDKLTNL
jgi:hypothetical protein